MVRHTSPLPTASLAPRLEPEHVSGWGMYSGGLPEMHRGQEEEAQRGELAHSRPHSWLRLPMPRAVLSLVLGLKKAGAETSDTARCLLKVTTGLLVQWGQGDRRLRGQ